VANPQSNFLNHLANTPDFYVADFNAYLEIKGHETELDRCKWSQFQHNLIVWKKKELVEHGLLKKKSQ
jgi:hypothetical protein